MKIGTIFGLIAVLFLLGITVTNAQRSQPAQPSQNLVPQAASTRAFTYQGRLLDNANPANGSYDFTFILYDASVGGDQSGPIISSNNVEVSNRIFNVILDFGNSFDSTQYYLDISVRPGASSGSYTQLPPRQPLTAAPYASDVVLPLDQSTSTSGSAFIIDNNGSGQKSSGSFKIDHPLDPANQYLYHSFVESPDMMNIYNGNVVLGVDGAAVVTMPAWFEALNMEFRYQLTAIGGPGPALYIAEEISNNQLKLAGGAGELKVSWQVTGIRHDAYANAHHIPVEAPKPADEKGTYIHPELFGKEASKSLDRLTNPLQEQPSEVQR